MPNVLAFETYKIGLSLTFTARKSNRKRVGLNAFANRVFVLNGRIPLDWFAMNIDTYKVHCKKEFLTK